MIVTSSDCACTYEANTKQLPLLALLHTFVHILESWHGWNGMHFIRVQGNCQFDESAWGCYANEGHQNIPSTTSHCCRHLRVESSLFAKLIQYDVRFTRVNITAPFGDHLSICNVSRVTAVPFHDMRASNTLVVQELPNGVKSLALRLSVEEISMPECRDFMTDSILEDVKVDLTTCHRDSWCPNCANIFYTQEHCEAVTLRPEWANLIND